MSLRVLCVEDERPIRGLIERYLASEHIVAQFCEDGRSAIAALERHPNRTDLLLADIGLPDVSGLFVIAEARRLRPHLPVVVLTGYAPADIREEIGGLAFLGKPFAGTQLHDAIQFAFLLADLQATHLTPPLHKSHERRCSPRYAARASAVVKAISPEMQWAEATARVADVSAGGFALIVPFAFPIGTEIMAKVDRLTLYGVVKHCDLDGAGYRAGVAMHHAIRSNRSPRDVSESLPF